MMFSSVEVEVQAAGDGLAAWKKFCRRTSFLALPSARAPGRGSGARHVGRDRRCGLGAHPPEVGGSGIDITPSTANVTARPSMNPIATARPLHTGLAGAPKVRL